VVLGFFVCRVGDCSLIFRPAERVVLEGGGTPADFFGGFWEGGDLIMDGMILVQQPCNSAVPLDTLLIERRDLVK
jgi:hypothetical protein